MTSPATAWLVSFESTPLDVPACQIGSQKSYGNEDINSYISSYINALGEAEFTVSVRHIERFSKAGIPTYNSRSPENNWQKDKKKRRRTQATAKRYAFHAKAIELKGLENNFNLH